MSGQEEFQIVRVYTFRWTGNRTLEAASSGEDTQQYPEQHAVRNIAGIFSFVLICLSYLSVFIFFFLLLIFFYKCIVF